MFWEIFLKLCDEKHVKPNQVTKAIGMSTAAATDWKKGAMPRDPALYKIAEYFGVSIEYLKGYTSLSVQEPPVVLFEETGKISMVPVYESVSAGFGTLAVNEIVEYIPFVFKVKQEAAESLFIRVRGDSMYPKIEDGDIILVHKQDSVDSGALAVVLVDGEEGLVKRVAYGDGWIELQSINPIYMPRRFAGHDIARVKVLGEVRKIMKDA